MCLFTNQENRDHHHDNNGIGDDNIDYFNDYGGDGPMTTSPGQENRDDIHHNDDDNGACRNDIRSKELGCTASELFGQNCTRSKSHIPTSLLENLLDKDVDHIM